MGRAARVTLLASVGVLAFAIVRTPTAAWWMTVLIALACADVTWYLYRTLRPRRVVHRGEWGVRLVDAGPRPRRVVKELREVEIGFREAREATTSTPVVVVNGVSLDTAERLASALRRHDADAEVVAAEV
jgi:ribosomal protein L7/L12